MKYGSILFFLLLTISFGIYAQTPAPPETDCIVYSVKEKKLVSPQSIIDKMDDYDVLFYGEEHDDRITHQLQAHLFELLHKKYGSNAVVSMEMFDRELQYVMDEYLSGLIKESYFRKDGRAWDNYRDYRPLVEYARENKLYVLAANAPFRYVNVASNKGMEALDSLTEDQKKTIAPLPYKLADGAYEEKLRNLGKDDKPKRKSKKMPPMMDTTNKPKYDMVKGHSLWDNTMAHSVFMYLESNPKAKIIHLNGRFHTDEFFGIVQRLHEFNPEIKPLVISSEAVDKKLTDIDFSEYEKNGDYIVITSMKARKKYK